MKSIDIETALYNALASDGFSASAHALPASLGADLPHIHVERTGGTRSDIVIDTHFVDFDVYASDEAAAMEHASNMCGWVMNLVGEALGTYCYGANITTLPYNNPDPRHPNVARATLKTQLITRIREV